MSTTIDQRVVEMKFDNASFERNVRTSINTVNNLKTSLNFSSATKGISGLASSMGKMLPIGSVTNSLSALDIAFMTTINRITNAAINAGVNMTKALTIEPVFTGFTEYETKMDSIKTILANTRDSGSNLEDVNKALSELNEYSDKTIYNFAQMTDMVGKFSATSGDLKSSVNIVKGLSNLAAEAGVENYKLQSALYQTSQAMSGSYFQKMDWNSLENASMATRKFRTDLIEMGESLGTFKGIEDTLEGLKNETIGFGATLEKGWLTTEVFGAVTEMYALDDAMTAAAGEVTTLTKLFGTLKERVQSGWAVSWETILGDYNESKTIYTELDRVIGGFLDGISESRNALLSAWKDLGGRTALIEGLGDSFKYLGDVMKPVVAAFTTIFNPVTAQQLYGLTYAFRRFAKTLIISQTTYDKVYLTFKGLFSVIDAISSLSSGLLTMGYSVVSTLLGLSNIDLLSVTSSLGNMAVNMNEWIQLNNPFVIAGEKIATCLHDFILNINLMDKGIYVIEKIQNELIQFANTTNKMFQESVPNLEAIKQSFLDFISALFNSDRSISLKAFSNLRTVVSDNLQLIVEKFDFVNKYFETFELKLDSIIRNISTGLSSLLNTFDINMGSILTIVAGLALMLPLKLLYKIMLFLSPLTNLGHVIDSLNDAIKAYSKKTNAEAMKEIAIAIAILAGSIALLTRLDSNKMRQASAGLIALSVGLLAFSAMVNAMDKLGQSNPAALLLATSASIILLTGALKAMESINHDLVLQNLGLIALLEVELVFMAGVMSSISPELSKGSLLLISMTLSLKILINILGDLDSAKICRIESSMPLLLKGMLGLIAISLASKNVSFGAAATIVAVAIAVDSLLKAFDRLDKMNTRDIMSNLTVVGVMMYGFGILMASSNLAGEYADKAGVSMLAMSGAVIILTHAIELISDISNSDLVKSLSVITSIELIFSHLIIATKLAGEHGHKAGTALLAMSVSMVILTQAMRIIAKIEPDDLDRALSALLKLELLFSLLIAVTGLAKNVTPTIYAISATIGILILAVGALTLIDENKIKMVSTSLAVVMGAFAIIVASTGLIQASVLPLVQLTGVVALLGVIVAALSYLKVDIAFSTLVGMSALLLAMTASLGLISLMGPVTLAALIPLAGMTLVVTALGLLIADLQNIDMTSVTPVLIGIGGMLIVMTAVLGGLVLVGSVAPAALFGMGLLAVALVGLGALAILAGGLVTLCPSIATVVDTGLPLLEQLGTGLGKIVGNVISGLGEGLTSCLPAIGDNLSGFAISMTPFISALGSIDVTALAGMKLLSEVVLLLAAASFVEAITSKIFGEGTLSTFGKGLAEFGTAMTNYGDSIVNLKSEKIIASAGAAEALATVARAIPKEKGLKGLIFGNGNWTSFKEGLPEFGTAMVDYGVAVGTLDTKAISTSVTSVSDLSEIANTLPNSGGVLADLFGDNTWAIFGTCLPAFGTTLKTYANNVAGLDTGAVSTSVDAAMLLSSLADTFGNSGGKIAELFGDNTWAKFSSGLVNFGEDLIDYQDAVDGVDLHKINISMHAADLMIGLLSRFVDAGGWMGEVFSKSTWTMLTAGLEQFGEALRVYSSSVNGIDIPAIYTDFYKFGNYIVEGFAAGIDENTFKAQAQTAAMAKAAADAAREELDIHSPSLVTKAIGAFFGSGFVKGIASFATDAFDISSFMASEAVVGLTEETMGMGDVLGSSFAEGMEGYSSASLGATNSMIASSTNAIDAYEAWLEERKFYNEISLDDELLGWLNLQQQYAEGSEERKKIDREVYTLRNNLIEESYQAELDWIEEEKYYDRLSKAEELAAYLRMQQVYEEGSEQRKAIDREVYSLQKDIYDAQKKYFEDAAAIQEDSTNKKIQLEQEYADKVKSINEELVNDIEAQNKAYDDAVKQRAESLYSAYGLFDKIGEPKEVTGDELISNLQGQVNEFDTWQGALDGLSARGLDEELVSELQNMGVSSLSEIQALSAMTDEQLNQYVDLWGQKHEQVNDRATFELESMRLETEATIVQMEADAAKELESYRLIWEQELDQLNEDTENQLFELETTFYEEVGVLKQNTEEQFDQMTTNVNNIMLQAGWDETGAQIVKGVVKGIEDNIFLALEAAAELGRATTEALNAELEVCSPSKVTRTTGRFFGEGFVNGIKEYADKAHSAGSSMAENAKLGLNNSLTNLLAVLDNDIVYEPTIRPVLDLTNVEGMNNKLFSDYSYQLAASTAKRRKPVDEPNQNGESDGSDTSNVTYNQYNYSPKALSRLDIYRQTKNQLSAMKLKGATV